MYFVNNKWSGVISAEEFITVLTTHPHDYTFTPCLNKKQAELFLL